MNKLQELYRGKSVSIQYEMYSGIKMTEFVDVSKSGNVTYSYQNNPPFSAIELEAKLNVSYRSKSNEFVIDDTVQLNNEPCPCCKKDAAKEEFEVPEGAINQYFTFNCKHCGYHSCNQTECDVCEEDHEEALKLYNHSLKADF